MTPSPVRRVIGRVFRTRPIYLVALAGLFGAAPSEAAYTPAYWYAGETLKLALWVAEPGPVRVELQAVDAAGRPTGARRVTLHERARGAHELAFAVGSEDGHRVALQVGARVYRLWCHRGVWAAGPEGLELQRRRRGVRLPHAYVRADDIQLVRGFSVSVLGNAAQRELVLERTFGPRGGQGLRPAREDALILVAKGDVGPIRVTLVERSGGRLRYFDGALVLDPEYRRFELPLAGFEAREPNTRLQSLHSVAIESVLPPVAGSTVTVAFLGLGRPSLSLASLSARGAGDARAKVQGPLASRARLWWRDQSGRVAGGLPIDARAGISIPALASEKLWVSAELVPGVEVTDPPDAPHTYYLRPPAPGEALLVDDFDAAASVNAQRGLVSRFASSEPVRERARLIRRPSALVLVDTPASTADYTGLHLHLRQRPDRALQSLELELAGAGPTAGLWIELTDLAHRAARLPLSAYLSELPVAPTRVALPLVAFESAHRAFHPKKPRAPLHRVSVVMRGAPPLGVERRLELDRVRFGPERAPIAIATFEGEDSGIDDLAHGQRVFAEGGRARVTTELVSAGHRGRALSISATELGGGGYALVHFGLGGLDVRDYTAIELVLRAPGPVPDGDLVLHDGRRAVRRPLAALGPITSEWTRLSWPIEALGGLRLDRLERLQLVFEGRGGSTARVELDELWVRP